MLKIDRSFVTALASEPIDRAIVAAVAGLAEAADVKIVAEGVETDEQRVLAHGLGCHQIQGYLISHPLPIEQLSACLGRSP